MTRDEMLEQVYKVLEQVTPHRLRGLEHFKKMNAHLTDVEVSSMYSSSKDLLKLINNNN